eukprot:TRINITY_DN2393_c0_g3_i1.p1 TRINITY_DN2393_c0_g3~~TRINITY_DN2393_c0_g3_i1.p1  ORF type:complete len:225 (-),score=24.62 TRINITY_DN2393_c0_g3_i1:147-821(-)
MKYNIRCLRQNPKSKRIVSQIGRPLAKSRVRKAATHYSFIEESPEEKSLSNFQKYSAILYKQETKFLINVADKSRNDLFSKHDDILVPFSGNESYYSHCKKHVASKHQDLLSNYERELLYAYTNMIIPKSTPQASSPHRNGRAKSIHRGRPLTTAGRLNGASLRFRSYSRPSANHCEFPLRISRMAFVLKKLGNSRCAEVRRGRSAAKSQSRIEFSVCGSGGNA